MTESEFVELLNRYETGLCSKEEKELVEKWLDSRGKGTNLSEAEKLRVKEKLRNAVFNEAGISKPEGKQVFFSSLLKIAASVLIVLTVGYGALTYYNNRVADKYATLETSSGSKVEKVLLSDGSIVWLKPGSSLLYPKNFTEEGNRSVILKGEAFFEVEKDPSHPFVVQCGDLTTTVLGTSFNIKTTLEQIEVLVLTGKVSLTSTNDQEGLIVMPSERAVYKTQVKQLAKLETAEKPVITEVIAGTQYAMDFERMNMWEVVKRIEGKFDINVSLSNPAIGNCLVTVDLTDKSLKTTLNVLTKILPLEYKFENNTILLSGEGCKE